MIVCGVFIHWEAKDDNKIYQYNYEATKVAIAARHEGRAEDRRDHGEEGHGQAPVLAEVSTTHALGTADAQRSDGVSTAARRRIALIRLLAAPRSSVAQWPDRCGSAVMSEKRKILIQLDTDPHPSVFDRVVAIDAGVDELFSYGGVKPEQVAGLVHGAIFTRGPAT